MVFNFKASHKMNILRSIKSSSAKDSTRMKGEGRKKQERFTKIQKKHKSSEV
jgi:hypothetical protein